MVYLIIGRVVIAECLNVFQKLSKVGGQVLQEESMVVTFFHLADLDGEIDISLIAISLIVDNVQSRTCSLSLIFLQGSAPFTNSTIMYRSDQRSSWRPCVFGDKAGN